MSLDFGDILRSAAQRHPRRSAMWCDGFEQTYPELFERACRLSNALTGLGAGHGDRVALLGPNGTRTVEQIAGIALAGHVRAGLYAHQTGAVNGYLLGLVGARVLVVQAPLWTAELRAALPACVEHVVVYGGAAPEGTLDYEWLVTAAPAADPHVRCAPGDVHVIRFSAGTTGRPKGIFHTNAGWLAMGDEYRWCTPQMDERDRYLAAGQLTHAAVIFLWPTLQVGGQIVVMEAFEPARLLELVEQRRITFTLMVPTMMQVLCAHPDARTRDLSSLRCLNYAASPISETTMTAALATFGPVLFQMYGQSEAVPLTMLLPHQHEGPRMRSVGRPTPNTVVTIVDEAGAPLPIGEIGEIAARTPGAMAGLWGDPEGTARRLLADGSVLTRDMGRLDDEGFVFLADRKEDMIISGGYNIWPAELENAVAAHPAVAEVCVVGVPHEKWGETPKAVVVTVPGAHLDEREIVELTRRRVGAVEKVTSVDVVDALPKSGVGKVLRREVRERYWTDTERRVGTA